MGNEIEVTPEMVEAGLEELYKFPIIDPWEDQLREAVTRVFLAMSRVQP
jgi:hypothetical protein